MSIDEPRDYHNHQVVINDNWQFTVIGPEFNDSESHTIFESAKAAREEIDKRIAERIRLNPITLTERLIDETGRDFTLTGINRQNGKARGEYGDSTATLPVGGNLYPAFQWIRSRLAEQKSLFSRLKEIEAELKPVNIPIHRAYGRLSADNYGKHIERLKNDIDGARDKAKARQDELKAENAKPNLEIVSGA